MRIRTSPRGKSDGKGGFTLIEIAVVLFILSLVLLTALPRVSLISSGGAEGFMRKAALRIEQTLEDAIFESRGGQLLVNIPEGVIQGYRSDGEELVMNWSLELPESLMITSVTTNFGKEYLTEEVIIPYSNMGFIPRTFITVKEEDFLEAHTITINSFTGKVSIDVGTVDEQT